jgi:hypothetical protein
LGQTGVEMEALTAVSIACLTIYDMLKQSTGRCGSTRSRLCANAAASPEIFRATRLCRHEWRTAADGGAGPRPHPGECAERLPVRGRRPERATGRTLAVDLAAKRTQPPTAVSAMDGYAVRARDLAQLPVKLKQIGESTAGHGFSGSLGPKETVRIFTGAPVPDGCDTILIQENARVEAGFVEPLQSVASGRHIRAKGIDFTEGEVLLAAGTRLGASNIALAAAMNCAEVAVTRRPRVGILATGDELASRRH